ncbi:MAG: HAMP domain-containing protein [Pseudomonadales bacterium]|nr:HAMP domain-containing protein [Pseudomonadales bacterium]
MVLGAFERAQVYQTAVGISIFTGLSLVILILIVPLVRRLRVLAKTAEAFGAGNFDARVPPGGARAVAEPGTAFNRMADRLKQAEARHQILTHALSHEVRTPPARHRLFLEMVEDMDVPEQQRLFLQDIQRDVRC